MILFMSIPAMSRFRVWLSTTRSPRPDGSDLNRHARQLLIFIGFPLFQSKILHLIEFAIISLVFGCNRDASSS
jgi:hypothetical protein